VEIASILSFRRKRNKQAYASLYRIEDVKINGNKIYLKRVLEFYNTAKDEYLSGTDSGVNHRWVDASAQQVRTFVDENDPEQTVLAISEIEISPELLACGSENILSDWNRHGESLNLVENTPKIMGIFLGEAGVEYEANAETNRYQVLTPGPPIVLLTERVLSGPSCTIWDSPTFFEKFNQSFAPSIEFKLNNISTLKYPELHIPAEISPGNYSEILAYLRDTLPDGSILLGEYDISEQIDGVEHLVYRKIDAELEAKMGKVLIDLTDFSEQVPRVHINKKCNLNFNGDNAEIKPGVYEILLPYRKDTNLTDIRSLILAAVKMTSMTIDVNRMDFLSSIEASESNLGASLRDVELESLDVEDFNSTARKGNLDRFQF